MQITTKLLPISQRRSGIKNLGIKFLVAHDTANDGTNATTNVNYYISSANDMQASAHYFVDDKEAVNCIPEDEKSWHVQYGSPVDNKMFGCEANDCALGIELCYSTKGIFDSKRAYDNYCELLASLCRKYNLDPMTKIVAHSTLDPARRSDPQNAFSKIGKTWDQFLKDVWSYAVTHDEMVSIQVPKDKVEIVQAILAILK